MTTRLPACATLAAYLLVACSAGHSPEPVPISPAQHGVSHGVDATSETPARADASQSPRGSEIDARGSDVEGSRSSADGGDATEAVDRSEPDATAGSPAADARPRIGSIGRVTWIYQRPSRRGEPIGNIHPGHSVLLRNAEPATGDGCQSRRWYAVEPRGYVCLDRTATIDLASEPFRALATLSPDEASPLPYRYAISTGAPMYGRMPDAEEQRKVERAYRPVNKIPRNKRPVSSHEELASDEAIAASDVPPYFAFGGELPRMPDQKAGLLRWEMPEGALFSFRRAVDVSGRVFLLSPDLTAVPADRVRLFRTSTFHGVELGSTWSLPLAWTRQMARPKFRRGDDGNMTEIGQAWPARTPIPLTGQKIEHKGQFFVETREQGLFIKQSDASVVEPTARLPLVLAAGEKWIDVSIDKGTLTLYVGQTPVFSTLASPGGGGAAPRATMSEDELIQGPYTPVGIYRITYKVRVTTMTHEKTQIPRRFWIADVPHTLYFRMPYAIHGAYWHEDFGQPKSDGCINLSPIDARRVFEWTEPRVPDDWGGATGGAVNGLGTRVFVHR